MLCAREMAINILMNSPIGHNDSKCDSYLMGMIEFRLRPATRVATQAPHALRTGTTFVYVLHAHGWTVDSVRVGICQAFSRCHIKLVGYGLYGGGAMMRVCIVRHII